MKVPDKPTITDYFFFDNSLGLPSLTEVEIERKELAVEVLQFMWMLCLDDAVYGILEQPLNHLLLPQPGAVV